MNIQQITESLADKQAINTILDACSLEIENGIVWRNTDKLRNCSSVVWEVKYLRIRGLLCNHPHKEHLVKLKGGHEKTI